MFFGQKSLTAGGPPLVENALNIFHFLGSFSLVLVTSTSHNIGYDDSGDTSDVKLKAKS